jgi:rubrerythrin
MTETGTLTALEIAKIACDIESEGIDFYRAAASVTSNAQSKNLFNDLAQQEFEHLSTFRELYKQLDEKMGGSESSTEFLFDNHLTQYLKSISQGVIFPEGSNAQTWISNQTDIREILKFALEAEKNSILLYTEIINHNTFAYSKEMLSKIIAEEKSHLIRLSNQLNLNK